MARRRRRMTRTTTMAGPSTTSSTPTARPTGCPGRRTHRRRWPSHRMTTTTMAWPSTSSSVLSLSISSVVIDRQTAISVVVRRPGCHRRMTSSVSFHVVCCGTTTVKDVVRHVVICLRQSSSVFSFSRALMVTVAVVVIFS